MTSQLHLMNKWILDSKMKLNIQKSSVMWFRVSSRKKVVYPDIFVNDVALRQVDKQKYLGVVFDTRLYHIRLRSNKKGLLETTGLLGCLVTWCSCVRVYNEQHRSN